MVPAGPTARHFSDGWAEEHRLSVADYTKGFPLMLTNPLVEILTTSANFYTPWSAAITVPSSFITKGLSVSSDFSASYST
jgi:hypothetical protein